MYGPTLKLDDFSHAVTQSFRFAHVVPHLRRKGDFGNGLKCVISGSSFLERCGETILLYSAGMSGGGILAGISGASGQWCQDWWFSCQTWPWHSFTLGPTPALNTRCTHACTQRHAYQAHIWVTSSARWPLDNGTAPRCLPGGTYMHSEHFNQGIQRRNTHDSGLGSVLGP